MSPSLIDSLGGDEGQDTRPGTRDGGGQTRPVSPEDVAAAVLRLASPAAQENGETIVVV